MDFFTLILFWLINNLAYTIATFVGMMMFAACGALIYGVCVFLARFFVGR